MRLLIAICVLACAATCFAQTDLPLSEFQFREYCDLLHLETDSRTSAADLYSGYVTGFRSAGAEFEALSNEKRIGRPTEDERKQRMSRSEKAGEARRLLDRGLVADLHVLSRDPDGTLGKQAEAALNRHRVLCEFGDRAGRYDVIEACYRLGLSDWPTSSALFASYSSELEKLLAQMESLSARCEAALKGQGPRDPMPPGFIVVAKEIENVKARISKVHRSYLNQIQQQLPAPKARELLHDYFHSAATKYSPAAAEIAHAAALADPSLKESDRESLKALYERFIREDDVLADAWVNATIDRSRATTNAVLDGVMVNQVDSTRLNESRAALRQHRSAWAKKLRELGIAVPDDGSSERPK